ncbi:hypothetical protein PMAYCL1PPCAC_25727, partial [Pristionchus mayeri]
LSLFIAFFSFSISSFSFCGSTFSFNSSGAAVILQEVLGKNLGDNVVYFILLKSPEMLEYSGRLHFSLHSFQLIRIDSGKQFVDHLQYVGDAEMIRIHEGCGQSGHRLLSQQREDLRRRALLREADERIRAANLAVGVSCLHNLDEKCEQSVVDHCLPLFLCSSNNMINELDASLDDGGSLCLTHYIRQYSQRAQVDHRLLRRVIARSYVDENLK